MYTSPHLVSFRERIQAGRSLIGPGEVADLVERVQPVLAEVTEANEGRHPTFFETVTVMALCYFQQREVELVVWETGLGGRLDATNVVMPAVSVITSIAADHAEHLGSRLEQIAAEKCGIIKPGIPVVTCRQDRAVEQVIRRSCDDRGCALTLVGNDLAAESVDLTAAGQTVRLTGTAGCDGVYEISLGGLEQAINCGLAVAALEQCGERVGSDALAEGLRCTCWPGRFQLIDGAPPVIVDGAHNPAAIRGLVKNLDRRYGGRSVAVLFGILADKEIEEVCRLLAPVADAICCVPVRGERGSAEPDKLIQLLRAAREDLAVSSARSALAGLAALRGGGYDVVVVAGSLYLAGEVLAAMAPPYGVEPDPAPTTRP
jgi:dihydrofolate synthase/folylpolyglutamate synthase